MGDYYGTGIRNKIGTVREIIGMRELSPKQRNTPPKSLA
jgi:hypothetical protein